MHTDITDISTTEATAIPSQFSCCCNNSTCQNLELFTEAFKKLQYDSMLAAEIGQALLKTRKSTSNLELDEDVTDTDEETEEELTVQILKDNLHELKQLRWENERATHSITMLEKELSSLKLNSIELKKQVNKYREDSEKKGAMEQVLKERNAQLEERFKTEILDLKQELHHTIKRENSLMARYKKLESSYETLQATYESQQKEYKNNLAKEDELKITKENTAESRTRDVNQDTPTDALLASNMTPMPNSYHRKDKRAAVCYPSDFVYNNNLANNCNRNPFDVLRSVTQELVDKINATDTRVLNKRLKRGVYNISELSELSNSILEQILKDLNADFRPKFERAAAECHLSSEENGSPAYDDGKSTFSNEKVIHFTASATFFSLVDLIQFLLQDWGTNKMTLNDLQADYVRRIETLTKTSSTSLLPVNPIKASDASILNPLSQHKLTMKSTVASVRASTPATSMLANTCRTDRGHSRRQGLLSFFG